MPSQAGGLLAEALIKGATKGLYNLGRKGASEAVKSNYAKQETKGIANKYLDQALDSFTADLSKKLDPFSGGNIGLIFDGINIGKKVSTTLFPQTKEMFKKYEDGRMIKEMTNKRDGLFTKRFWNPSDRTIIADKFLEKQCTRGFPMKNGKVMNVDCDEPTGGGIDIH